MQSDTNKFFNELKGLADDMQSLRDKNAALAAENERLRKAGDAMADTRNKPTTLSEFGHLAMAWFAAKEGKDAK